MTDDLKERLRINLYYSWGDESDVGEQALARITDLEAKLQRLGRELNLAKYGEPDFAWEIHKNAVADLEARLAAAEAGEDALAEMVERAQTIFAHCKVTEGCCCCGDDMENHAEPINCGHAPVDHGQYIASGWVEDAAAALTAYEARRKG